MTTVSLYDPQTLYRLGGGPGADRFFGGPGKDRASDFSPAGGDSQDGTVP